MPESIISTLITAAVTLVVSFGTWHFSIKKDRDKSREELKTTLTASINTLKDDLESLKDNVASGNSTVRNEISLVNLKIETLSDRVEKHNNVIERVYKLEQAVADMKDV